LAENRTFERGEIELALQSLGWEVVICHSADESLQLWKENGFELVLLGLSLEDGDGLSVARGIRAHEGATPKALIIATIKTGAVQEETACVQAGMDGVINFDCDREELRAQLRKWLAKLAFRMWKTEGLPRLTLDRIWTGNNK